jgi:L-aspartate oxidase
MASTMADQGVDHLWLDATGLERFGARFPTIASSLQAIGLDPKTDWLPIAPAAHHLSGGVVTDLWGASALPGLWAAGEVACSGVHGANRLASNSLLEGMVFGARLAEQIALGTQGPENSGALRSVMGTNDPETIGPDHHDGVGSGSGLTDLDVAKGRESLQFAMTAGAGVVRTESSLLRAGEALELIAQGLSPKSSDDASTTVEAGELQNLLTVARALLASAGLRRESRGAHTRADFPETDPSWRTRLVHQGTGT